MLEQSVPSGNSMWMFSAGSSWPARFWNRVVGFLFLGPFVALCLHKGQNTIFCVADFYFRLRKTELKKNEYENSLKEAAKCTSWVTRPFPLSPLEVLHLIRKADSK